VIIRTCDSKECDQFVNLLNGNSEPEAGGGGGEKIGRERIENE